METHCTKYITTIEKLGETIRDYGVAIIEKVINEEECEKMLSGVRSYFEHITQNWEIPFKHDDPNSWKQFYKLLPLHNMLVQHYSIGHAQCSWDLRQNPKIVDVFAKFWGVEHDELLVSFDGLSYQLPPEQTKKAFIKVIIGFILINHILEMSLIVFKAGFLL